MRTNLPVTQREYDYPDGTLIVSSTDAQGRITHCNQSFVDVSGFTYDELMGQPHNLVRHPDVPPEAFKDLWSTCGRGRPWTGIVKNRRKNGDHYWVKANVTPIMEDGKPVAYMSVRFKPSREEIAAAEALYARVDEQRRSGRQTFKLHAGYIRYLGWRDWPQRLHRMTLVQRVAAGIAGLVGATLGVAFVVPAAWTLAAQALVSVGLSAAFLAWFGLSVQRRLDQAQAFARDLAACNLKSQLDIAHPNPLSLLTRYMVQVQTNLRAVVGDAREEVAGTSAAIAEVAKGSQNLSARTEAQASALQQTAASMEQLSGTVKQTAETSTDVARHSEQTAAVAAEGGDAVGTVGQTIEAIESSSRKVADIVQVIESIAFQTNILALNAAVEAARAGEQGRGFAVVASEVRALAGRSGTAAKEIRELIHASVEQVSDGVTRMSEARERIAQTVAEVNRGGDLVRQISHAAAEQSAGIAQVNAAVAELDRMTQANAALAEETAAVSSALHERSAALARAVQVFRL